MNKVFNWVFGSFFRTLGRIFAFLLIAFGFFVIIDKIGFKFDLSNFLPFMKVNAEVINETDWANNKNQFSKFQFYDCTSSSCTTQSSSCGQYSYNTTSGNIFYACSNETRFTIATNGVGVANWLGTLKKDYLYSYTAYYCSGSTFANSSTNKFIYTSSSGSVLGKNALAPVYQSHNWTTMSNKPGSESGSLMPSNCYAVTSLFVPSADSTWVSQHFTASSSSISDVRIFPVVWTLSELGIYSTAVKDIIDDSGFASAESVEQVQDSVNDVKQEISETNQTITNDDTSGAQDSAGGFFDSFESNDFGLSSIITAPLRAINAMLNDTCVAPSATYKGQTFSLPCGDMLWSRPGADDLKAFLNVMYGGFLVYYVIRSLFLDIERLKNPDNDKVEVSKL